MYIQYFHSFYLSIRKQEKILTLDSPTNYERTKPSIVIPLDSLFNVPMTSVQSIHNSSK